MQSQVRYPLRPLAKVLASLMYLALAMPTEAQNRTSLEAWSCFDFPYLGTEPTFLLLRRGTEGGWNLFGEEPRCRFAISKNDLGVRGFHPGFFTNYAEPDRANGTSRMPPPICMRTRPAPQAGRVMLERCRQISQECGEDVE